MLELFAGIVVAVAVLAIVLEPLARGRQWAVTGSADVELDLLLWLYTKGLQS